MCTLMCTEYAPILLMKNYKKIFHIKEYIQNKNYLIFSSHFLFVDCCCAKEEILDIVPEWPGSEHNDRIFQNSRIYMRYR